MPTGSVPCRSCGRPMPAGSLTCPSCGAPIVASDPPGEARPSIFADDIGDTAAADGLTAGGIVPNPAVPGSYLSPSSVYQARPVEPEPPMVMPLAGTAAPSSDDATEGTAAGMSASPAYVSPVPPGMPPAPATASGGPATASGGPAAVRPGKAPLLADLPFDAPDSLAGWLVAAGSSIGAVSFLLPWAPRIVDYTSSWGFASLSNLPVLGLLIVTAVLAILPNRVAPWVRSGVLGLMGGSLFLGLLWPYVVGDFGAEFGSIAGAAAAIVLIAGGTLSVAPRGDRPPAA